MAQERKEKVSTLEKGDIYFFYRPKVEEESPESREDVQRLYMVLHPEKEKKYRLSIIGRKRMPDPAVSGKERYWGFVQVVRKDPKAIRDELREEKYRTKTRGEREIPAARPLGEGIYRIARHGNHTHLLYSLELPKEPGEPQEEFQIEEEASYIMSIKNPEKPTPPSAGLGEARQAEYPKKLQEVFRDRRFADVDPPEFMDHEGTQFVLVAALEDIKEDMGIDLETENESRASADVFKDLKLDRSKHPTKPLFEGEWE
ncbi:MAG: hypothetical protein C4520_16385 [Candidatus Abyssobacteria bacterium SURF_5]|uniref:Uncharacterized protein n=1 Tax=Abyssobacteria bacterium (strain SURF_5) TaxID=2093360 RepID=A0A3A4NPZ2_ABYX5|nr:MAG: hypothetical protein C4520_16385 [Candidatus Abyssubacteria bacterium SURF_5]